MTYPHGVTVTVRSSNVTVDKYGDTNGAAPTDASWGPVAIAPRTTVERVDDTTPAVVTGLTIYGPETTIEADAQIIVPVGHPYAGTWLVDGLPGVWRNPLTGSTPGLEVAVKRASGS